MPVAATVLKPTLSTTAWLTIDPIAAMIVKTAVPSPNSTAE